MDASGIGHIFILQTGEFFQLSLWSPVLVALLGRFCMNRRRKHLSRVLAALRNTLVLLAKMKGRPDLKGGRVQVK